MFEVIVLGSGSDGNAAVICNGKTRLLIDAGLGVKKLKNRLEQADVDPCSLSGILLTHEHRDHTSGLWSLCKRHTLPIYCNAQTAHVLRRNMPSLATYSNWRLFETGVTFEIDHIAVQSFSVPHDAVDPVGYVIDDQQDTLGILTDLGHVTHSIVDSLRTVRTLLIEMNHDEQLLNDDPHRPWAVKQRILSSHGHLSNKTAAKIISQLAEQHLKQVIAAHLSRDCNHPDKVHESIHLALTTAGLAPIRVDCASQSEILFVS